MKELHIPYGIDRLTRQIIEPEDAERGRACDCLCPGCEAPLLSRHPQRDDRRTHFAHDSKHADAKPIDDCPLSPEVAFAMMARYVAGSLAGKTIQLGAYEKSLSHPCCLPSSTLIELIAKQEAVIERAEAFVSIGGVQYDLGLTLNGRSYFIDITYPGKPKKDLPGAEHLDGIGGVMSVWAGQYLAMMMGEEVCHKMRYSESVEHFLLNHSSYDWEYHHLEVAKLAEAQQQHKCSPALSTQLFGHRQATHYNSYGGAYSTSSGTPVYDSPANVERTVKCHYCGQPMTTRSTRQPAMGHKCEICRKYNREAPNPHPRSLITKESNHSANQAAMRAEAEVKSVNKASLDYKNIRG